MGQLSLFVDASIAPAYLPPKALIFPLKTLFSPQLLLEFNELQRVLPMHHKVSEGGAVSDVFIPYDRLLDHGVPYTRVHLNRLMRKGLFPVAVQLSPNRIAWRLADVEQWKASRPPARSAA